MIKSKLLLQLLMRLLTNPPCLDGGGQRAQIRRRRKIGEIVFALPGGTLLANEPDFVAWEMLLTFIPYPLRRAVGGADTEGSKSGFEPTFRPATPTHGFPFGAGQHLFCRNR
ncbi:hypothetical protein F07S3_22090 [Bradyrhizobium diazoefficiens]|uniref:Uncharacterized protein n=1 Tax=Bradyrhizobium diazoefficiens TaxID=1355477 RepID=A0A810B7H8_9BRAD|nr:hypothetical protein F07S3_22090 [Bradyrhizobium diazoefficiens]BCA10125.1 hypothetical protein BDHF08_19720 [Bradyrhizobium diazoefficiens]BCE71670.1 hypothetical protein XF8B_17810 [Bradyrhizobium diazoefficiens]GLR97056.1 hypothetical protein GCM10007858_46950 [Bradyrhizobium liaoningense]